MHLQGLGQLSEAALGRAIPAPQGLTHRGRACDPGHPFLAYFINRIADYELTCLLLIRHRCTCNDFTARIDWHDDARMRVIS